MRGNIKMIKQQVVYFITVHRLLRILSSYKVCKHTVQGT
jgi:hypothetical protein